MSEAGRTTRPFAGSGTLTSALLLVAAIAGLWVLKSQIAVFGFGGGGPDARSVPRTVLALLALLLILRFVLGRKRDDIALGARRNWLRVAAVGFAVIAALLLMPGFGFFVGALFVGLAASLTFGERNPLVVAALPLLVAGLVTAGARYGLNIPLP